ncbi:MULTISPECIES: trypco2 family protein [unclassified Streptomyces]|uniref:trypco2 family protein n=1 Tax=unclassified Streptomyces TaxID=2593676 RepID=UPI002E2B4F42|nr:trypco2 family protein [Streptomyces sp. NBC_00223]
MGDPTEFVGLAEVIRQIRGELEQAREEARDQALGFTVEKVSLEFTVQVHKSGSAQGGLRIGVVTAEAGGGVERGTTHRVQVDLTPEYQTGRLNVTRTPL